MSAATTPAKSSSLQRPLHWYDAISINIYFLGLTVVSQTNGLIYPLLVQQFVGQQVQGTYLGMLRLWTLMIALLMQAVWGMLSDRNTSRWGRRRPFIFLGTLVDLVFIAAIGFSIGLEGMGGFWFLFGVALLLSVSANSAHAAQQGLIPDLVPEHMRGKYSGIKAILELPVPLILVSFTVARLISRGLWWPGILLAMGLLVFSMLIAMAAPEEALKQKPAPFNWQPILRLGLMAAIFTAIILGTGQAVRWVGQLTIGLGGSRVFVMGIAGLLGMLVAVALGVWVSVRISIGQESAREHGSFTWWVINRLAFLVGIVNLSTFAIYFIQARLGYERETAAGPAALLMTVVGVFILVVAFPSGWLSDRVGRKPVLAASGMLAALGTLIALLFTSLTVIYIGGSIIGIAAGLFYTANWALGTDIVPRDQAGRYLGISNLAGAGAGAVGAYIGGPIADYFTVNIPEAAGLGYVVLFAIYGALFLLSILALLNIREIHRNENEGEASA
jgi:MFS family permease